MGVDLGCCDARVAKKPLNEPYVYSTLEKKSCCGMAQHMWRHRSAHSGPSNQCVKAQAEALRRHRAAPAIAEEEGVRVFTIMKRSNVPGENFPNARVGHDDDALPRPLAEYRDLPSIRPHLTKTERAELRYP